jgi:hypothetical protein
MRKKTFAVKTWALTGEWKPVTIATRPSIEAAMAIFRKQSPGPMQAVALVDNKNRLYCQRNRYTQQVETIRYNHRRPLTFDEHVAD